MRTLAAWLLFLFFIFLLPSMRVALREKTSRCPPYENFYFRSSKWTNIINASPIRILAMWISKNVKICTWQPLCRQCSASFFYKKIGFLLVLGLTRFTVKRIRCKVCAAAPFKNATFARRMGSSASGSEIIEYRRKLSYENNNTIIFKWWERYTYIALHVIKIESVLVYGKELPSLYLIVLL